MRGVDRLVGVGVGADRDGGNLVRGFCQFRGQHPGDAGAGDEPGLEIESGGEVQEGVVGRAKQ
jgi:hypothetical protein